MRRTRHEIAGVDPVGRGWSARCSCAQRFSVHRDVNLAWADAAAHAALTSTDPDEAYAVEAIIRANRRAAREARAMAS